MKRLLCIVLLVLLVGCAPEETTNIKNTLVLTQAKETRIKTEWGTTTIVRIIDEEAGVVCYITNDSSYGGGISCLPLSETSLK